MANGELLEIEPLELKFHLELKKSISSSLQLSNKTEGHVAFKVKTTHPNKYCVRPNTGVIPPLSTCAVIVTMQTPKEIPADLNCKDRFLVQSIVANAGLTVKDLTAEMFSKDSGNVVEDCKLKVIQLSAPQPPSPVPEGSEEGLSPRNSLSENNESSAATVLLSAPRIFNEPREKSPDNHFTQVELLTLKSKFLLANKESSGHVTIGDLPSIMSNLKAFSGKLSEKDILNILREMYSDTTQQIDFESFLRVYLNLQQGILTKSGNVTHSSSFLKAITTTLLHTISESEKASYVSHINTYLGEDPFLSKYLPLDPETNDLFDLAKDGVLFCKLINVAVAGTIDERAINTKCVLNPWERNENHTLCLNSAKAIGCTVVNIGTQDLIEGRPHLVLGLLSQIIKVQLLADLSLKKTPQLVELVDDSNDVEELMSLAPEKVLLKWMNFHLKKAGYKKIVNNFSSDIKDGEAYIYLLSALIPEIATTNAFDIKYPIERAKWVLDQAAIIDCQNILTPKDIVDGSANLNLTFVAQIFQHRNGLSVTETTDTKKIEFASMPQDDELDTREERAFRLWINSLGIEEHVSNVFEDLRTGWVLLHVLDKISPGSVDWKFASKPPIKMPFRKVKNCNQVIRIGKQLKFSLVNLAGNDIVQGNKKLTLAFLWQLMRFNILQDLNNLWFHSQGKEITDVDILNWANCKVKSVGKSSQIESFKDKSISNGVFFLELLSAVDPRVVDWKLVTKGEQEEEKKMNATYLISVGRKLGCSIFLLPEDIIEVNQKMILTLTASIMHWSFLPSRCQNF